MCVRSLRCFIQRLDLPVLRASGGQSAPMMPAVLCRSVHQQCRSRSCQDFAALAKSGQGLPVAECSSDQLKARTLRSSLIELRKVRRAELPTTNELLNLFLPCGLQN